VNAARRVVAVPVWSIVVVLAVGLVSPILAVAAATTISARALAASEARFCELVSTLDDAYSETPPQTPAGKNLAAGIASLRCPGT
jgi:hypothetical protein